MAGEDGGCHVETTLKYRYILACGSNLGNPIINHQRALRELGEQGKIEVKRISRWLYTLPLASADYDVRDHRTYLNFIADIATPLLPSALFAFTRGLEDKIGHDRNTRWRPRSLDIDLLLWSRNDEAVFRRCRPLTYHDEELTIPHYDIMNRGFIKSLLQDDLGMGLSEMKRWATPSSLRLRG